MGYVPGFFQTQLALQIGRLLNYCWIVRDQAHCWVNFESAIPKLTTGGRQSLKNREATGARKVFPQGVHLFDFPSLRATSSLSYFGTLIHSGTLHSGVPNHSTFTPLT